MNKKGIFVGCSILLLLVLLVFGNKSNTVDWTPSFDDRGTNPLDTKIFFDQLPNWFKGDPPKKIHTTFYEYEYGFDKPYEPQTSENNYISISYDYDIDDTSFDALLEFVANGNHAFISANSFPRFVKDTLAFETAYEPLEMEEKERTLFLNFTSDKVAYHSKTIRGRGYIKDTLTVKNLGHFADKNDIKRTNFVGIPYYNGIFYIHTTPEVFTNYQMLHVDKPDYVNAIMSYLPDVPILLDKAVKLDPEIDQSPLRFITSKQPLKWAWYLLLLGIGLFLLFNAKRKQRIVPIIHPLKNTTTEFVHTVSNLHFESEDYDGIIQKMIVHFLEFVRSKYNLSTENLNQDFAKRLALKSGKSKKEIQYLVGLVSSMQAHRFKTKEPLVKLNKELEKFYTNE